MNKIILETVMNINLTTYDKELLFLLCNDSRMASAKFYYVAIDKFGILENYIDVLRD